MRILLGFVVLLAGIAAVSANLAEPRRYQTDMAPLAQGDGRVASFSAIAANAVEPVKVEPSTPAPIGPFKTTLQVSQVAQEQPILAAVPSYAANGGVNSLDGATRAALARDIQSELARLGCYAGPIDGSWSADTQRAAGLFVTEANARIPVGEPDFALFSLAKGATAQQACGPAATVAQATPAIEAPAMGLGGPVVEPATPKPASYHRDREVDSLFTNPLGR